MNKYRKLQTRQQEHYRRKAIGMVSKWTLAKVLRPIAKLLAVIVNCKVEYQDARDIGDKLEQGLLESTKMVEDFEAQS